MKIFNPISVTAVWLLLSGCQTVDADNDRPARIVDPDAESRAALQKAVDEAFGRKVMLADDALTETSLLTIERWPAGTIDNPVPQGRILERPIQFQLVRNDGDCYLVKKSDGSRYLLRGARCEVE